MPRIKKSGSFKDIIKTKLKGDDVDKTTPSALKKVKKVSKSKKTNNEEIAEESVSDLRIIIRKYPNASIEFEAFQTIPSDRKITKFTEVGSRVIVAKYPAFYKLYFMEYIDIGMPHFPKGALKIYNATFEQTQYFYYDSVALHPTKKDKYRTKSVDE